MPRVQTPSSHVSIGKGSVSEPQFSHLKNGRKSSPCLSEFLEE